MANRIPPEAFQYYLDLGSERSYRAVAARFGVTRRGVTKRAVKENWSGRIARIEAEARRRVDDRAAEDIRSIDERHLKTVRAIQARALDALRSLPLQSGMAAVRALEVAVKLERVILGKGARTGPTGPSLAELILGAAGVDAATVESDAARVECMRDAEQLENVANGAANRGVGRVP